MRHAIGLGVALLLLSTRDGLATGNQPPPCRSVSWVATGNMTTQRVLHAATLLPGGKVLVSGGIVDATAELYDPVTATWSPTGSMSVPRAEHTLTLLPTGKVLAVGGAGVTAELYDPDTGQWTPTGSMSVPRSEHTATLLPTGKVLVAGGEGLGSAELYNPATGQWQVTGSLSVPRQAHTATLLASGHVLVLGGLAVRGPTSSAELYDPAAGAWTPAAPMLAERYEHTATLLGSGVLLVAGGSGRSSSVPVPSEAELYDAASGAWRQTGSLSGSHYQHTATRLPSGRVLVVGGYSQSNSELFDPDAETWSDAGCTVEPRSEHTATLLPSGAVLVAGGTNAIGGQYFGSAELYGIVVSPTQVSLAPGASQTFTAKGGSGVGYVWSFTQNESGATLTASGDYRAGPVGGVTDVLRVVDSLANSGTATVNVVRQSSAVPGTGPSATAMGCGTTGAATFPALDGAVLVLLGWRALRLRRPFTPRVRAQC